DMVIGIPTITDNCGVRNIWWTLSGATTAASSTGGINYFTVWTMNAGVTTVDYYADDESGNISHASFTIMVQENVPVVTGPSIPSIPCMTASCDYTLDLVVATHSCASSGAFTYTYSISGATVRSGNTADASGHLNPGKSKIKWIVRDAAGFSAVCAST